MTQENQSREDIWNQLDAEDSAPVTSPAPAPQESAPQPAAPSSAAADTGIVNSEQAEDPYASLPPQVREEVVGMKTLLTQLSGRLRQAEGHIGNLTGQLKKAREATPAQPTAAQINAAQGSPEAWKALEDEYPEFAKIMKPAIESHFATLRSDIDSLKARPQQEVPDVLQRMETIQRETTVEIRHPGWKDLIQTPQFTGWLASQPPEVKLLADSPEPRDAIRLLDLHSAAKSNAGSRNQHLAAAAAIPTGRSSAVRQVNPDQMSPQDYWKFLDQLDAQKASAQR
jgi:hypothetical protein